MQFSQVDAKLVLILQHALPTLVEKSVEARLEPHHALAQVFEVEVDAWGAGPPSTASLTRYLVRDIELESAGSYAMVAIFAVL